MAIVAPARWKCRCALARTDTRCAHPREDRRALHPPQQRHLISGGLDEVWLDTPAAARPVGPAASAEVAAALA